MAIVIRWQPGLNREAFGPFKTGEDAAEWARDRWRKDDETRTTYIAIPLQATDTPTPGAGK